MEKVDYTKYPEGVKYLAENLEIPIPKENMAAREAFVFGTFKAMITL